MPEIVGRMPPAGKPNCWSSARRDADNAVLLKNWEWYPAI
jgi:hypothetical protein